MLSHSTLRSTDGKCVGKEVISCEVHRLSLQAEVLKSAVQQQACILCVLQREWAIPSASRFQSIS